MEDYTGNAEIRGGPLVGIRVIELGRYISAPFAGRLLADLGAEVIKVEAPDGDPMRWLPVGDRQSSPQFASYNRNKKSITLDLKSSEGRTVLESLIDSADVLIHNFRSDALERLGLDEVKLTDEHPGLVVCGISGFGATGEYAGSQGYDVIVSGLSGLYSQFVDMTDPKLVGPAFTDLITGLFAVHSLLAALVQRERSGRGQSVGITMLEAAMNFVNDAVTTEIETGAAPDHDSRQRRQHAFACVSKDLEAFIVHISEVPSKWRAFLDALGNPDWEGDERFSSYSNRCANFDQLDLLVKSATKKRARADWFKILRDRDLACGPLNSISDARKEEQVEVLSLLEDVPDVDEGQTLTMVRASGAFSTTPTTRSVAAPRPGEDTLELLRELDLTAETVDGARATWNLRRISR